jgi:autotransporter-associated beta strand protein
MARPTTVEVDAGAALTATGTIFGTGQLTKTGSGTLRLRAPSNFYPPASAWTGGTTISQGSLVVSGIAPLPGDVLNNASLEFVVVAGGTMSGSISGAGTLSFTDSHVTLAGNNSYTGETVVNGGALRFASPAAFPTIGSFTVGSAAYLGIPALNQQALDRFTKPDSLGTIGRPLTTVLISDTRLAQPVP